MGELGQGQRDFNLASIPVVCLIGMIYVQRLDLDQPLQFLRKSYCPKSAPPPARGTWNVKEREGTWLGIPKPTTLEQTPCPFYQTVNDITQD